MTQKKSASNQHPIPMQMVGHSGVASLAHYVADTKPEPVIKVLSINKVHRDTNYPCGRDAATGKMKTTNGSHVIQFGQNEKFIYVRQYCISRSSHKWSKPYIELRKQFAYLYREETGTIKRKFLYLGWIADIKYSCSFIANHFDDLQLPPEVVKYLYNRILHSLQNVEYFNPPHFFKLPPRDILLDLLQPTIDLLFQNTGTGKNVFAQISRYLDDVDEFSHFSAVLNL